MGVAKFTDVVHIYVKYLNVYMDILNTGAGTVLIHCVLCLTNSSIQASSCWPAINLYYHRVCKHGRHKENMKGRCDGL